jgi:hypothetical protein
MLTIFFKKKKEKKTKTETNKKENQNSKTRKKPSLKHLKVSQTSGEKAYVGRPTYGTNAWKDTCCICNVRNG